jgi:hypothetical protein
VAATVLGRLGKGDKAAVRVLTAALNDRDYIVRDAATNSFRSIEPEAAARAGVSVPGINAPLTPSQKGF